MTFLKRVFGSQEKKTKSAMMAPSSSSPINCTISPSTVPNTQAPLAAVNPVSAYYNHSGSLTIPPPVPDRPKYAFTDFEVTRTLGTGSFGRVCLARHHPTGQYFAMKKLRKSDVIRLKQVEHTNNERALLARVDHPFLVKMVCTHQDERHLYIFLEYVAGGEMFSLLRRVRVYYSFSLTIL